MGYFLWYDSILLINPILGIDIQRWQRKKEGKTGKKKERKRAKKIKKCTSMASTDCYKVNIHSYRFCVSYIGVSVSRVGPTCTAYSIFMFLNVECFLFLWVISLGYFLW